MLAKPLRLFAVCLAVIFLAAAEAHDPALSGLRIIARKDDVVVTVITHISRLAKAEGQDPHHVSQEELDRDVRKRLHLRSDGQLISPGKAQIIEDTPNDLLTWQTVDKPTTNWEVLSRLYPEDPTSVTVVTFLNEGRCTKETILDSIHPNLRERHPQRTRLAVAFSYLNDGILHILSGPDHILFVIGLLLMGGSLRSLLRIITAFTVAHSITLSLSATGIFAPSPKIVEPLIALSIVAIAIENLRQIRLRSASQASRPDFRPGYAFAFGLVHGFGFAGALSEIGLEIQSLWLALASFNVGVECGQAMIVLAAAPLIAKLATTKPNIYPKFILVGSICLGLAGAFWFATRLLAD
jgi:hypothetical protein